MFNLLYYFKYIYSIDIIKSSDNLYFTLKNNFKYNNKKIKK